MEDGEALAILLPQVQATGPCTHAPDFRSVTWYGKPYRFTPIQAAIIKILWEARDHGTPDVGGQTLLEEAGSANGRLRDVFRGCPAWEDGMIAPSGKGTYALFAPDEAP